MTLGYILFGSVSLYFMNIIRLVILTLGYYYFPQQRHLMHDVFFPLIIYGLLLLLWIIWIKINVREKIKYSIQLRIILALILVFFLFWLESYKMNYFMTLLYTF